LADVGNIDINSDAETNGIDKLAGHKGIALNPDTIQLLQLKCGNNPRI
jgi:hypothetical protein